LKSGQRIRFNKCLIATGNIWIYTFKLKCFTFRFSTKDLK
jgi:hypothetical protein